MYFIVPISYRGFLDKNTKLWVGCNVERENICNICRVILGGICISVGGNIRI